MELINTNRILLNKVMKNKNEAIKEMAKLFVEDGIVDNYDEYLKALMDREAIAETAVGYEVGLPHGKSAAVKYPAVAFARLSNDIMWSEEEQETAKYIFMLAIPSAAAGNEHINILVNLSKKILDDDFRELLSKSNDVKEIMDAINN